MYNALSVGHVGLRLAQALRSSMSVLILRILHTLHTRKAICQVIFPELQVIIGGEANGFALII